MAIATMTRFKVYDLEVWAGLEEGDWDINDFIFKGEYECEYNGDDIIQMMKDEGFISVLVMLDDIEILNASNGVIQICDAHDMKPVYHLTYEA